MSEVKVNKISPRTNCGTVTLGDSGDTFTIPAGVSITNSGTASGFGATGAASWNTTVKTGDFTAISGEGYFVNTTSGAVNVTLPAGSAGSVVAIKDYAGTFDTNAVTLVRNGSDKIGGVAVNGTLETEGIAVTLVFVDSTQGWLVTDSGLQDEAPTRKYVTATGGTVLTNGNFKTHVFTGPGTFCVSSAGNSCGSNTVDYMVVAGGGGSAVNGGGGGAGGFRISNSTGCVPAPTMSPLVAPAGLPVSVQGYPIVIGGGGTAAGPYPSTTNAPGVASSFSTISSAGGGEGSDQCVTFNGGPGGSGGGARPPGTAGTGNTPPVSPPQGNPGGPLGCSPNAWSSGGGAGAAGTSAAPQVGGIGSFTADSVFGPTAPSYGTPGPVSSTRYFAGGGGGANQGPTSGSTHAGGAGGGGTGASVDNTDNTAGTTNTGGGAGSGNGGGGAGAAGGSGIVVIRYKFQ